MFKNWGTWFGIESENGQVNQEGESIVDVHEDKSQEINKPTAAAESEQSGAAEKDADPPQLLQAARGFSGKFNKVQYSTSCDSRLG